MVPAAGHPALRTRLRGFYHLVRPQNCLASALATLLGVHLSDGSAGAGPVRVAASMLVVSVVLAASYVVNDLRDADADMLGNPGRAIPSGRVSRREAAGLWWALAAGGSALAFVLGADLGLMAALCAGAGVVYSYWLKGTVLVGNAFVGLVASTPVVFGSMAGGRPTDDTWFAAVVMLLFIFGDEVLKAIGDRVADGAAGLRTIGTQLRLGSGLLVFRAIALCFVGTAILPLALGRAGLLYGAGILAGAVGPVLWNVWLLTVRPEPASVPVALRLSKKVWFTGLWALWFLR